MHSTACAAAVATIRTAFTTGFKALALALTLAPAGHGAALATPTAPATPTKLGSAANGQLLFDAGRRLDGTPLRARRNHIGNVPAAAVACSGCHRRSAMGNQEAGLLVPALAGERLFMPANKQTLTGAHPSLKRQELRANDRPAYDVNTLARALTRGIDSGGRPLDAAMPRYELTPRDIADIVAHLRAIGDKAPSGLSPRQMRVASVITPDATPQARDAVKALMSAWAKRTRVGAWQVSWQPWELQGKPDTWPAQLQAHWAREDVFALVSGAGGAQWQAVADFCEARELPCLFPTLESAPAQAATHFFSTYLAGGVQAEAALLANHLREYPMQAPQRMVSVADPADASAQAGNRALHATLSAQNVRPFAPGAQPESLVAQLQTGEAAMLWLRPAQVQQLLDRNPSPPAQLRLWLSATLAPPHLVIVPLAWRPHVAWVSLHSDAVRRDAGGAVSAQPWLQHLGLAAAPDPVVLADVHAATVFFADALGRMREGVSAAYLLERLESSVDQRAAGAGYFRLSLAPGQRVAAQGGHVLAFTGGRLVPSGRLLPAPATAQ
jgi:mono/diheme cytochrome c family protein